MSAIISKSELPQFLLDLLAAVPASGGGVHPWLFKVSRQLHAHRTAEEIFALLRASVDGCGRCVPDSEILAAIKDAAECAWKPNATASHITKPRPKWPSRDAPRIAEILADPFSIYRMWEASPARLEPGGWPSEMILEILFPGDPLLCIGKTMAEFSTAPRSSFHNLSEQSLIVPSAMSATHGKRKADGKPSMHTLENTGPRQYLVCEFDTGTQDEQSTIIHHLAKFAPLVMVLSSGGKSLHSWFLCQGATDDEQRRFFRYAVSLGADPATWTRSQFVRMPEGWRADKGTLQAVFYFDFEIVNGGIEL